MFSHTKQIQQTEKKLGSTELSIEYVKDCLFFTGSRQRIVSLMKPLVRQYGLTFPEGNTEAKSTLVVRSGVLCKLTEDKACQVIKLLRNNELMNESEEEEAIAIIRKTIPDPVKSAYVR